MIDKLCKAIPTTNIRPRVIVTSDGEFDDENSLIHLLLYANELDIAGIVQTSSYYHWKGSPNGTESRYGSGKYPNRWPGDRWIFKIIDAYEKVYLNLLVHDPNYPTPDYLRSVSKIGNVGYEGEMDGPTEGSNYIKDCILDDDPRTLFIEFWGGPNTCAMALKQIEEEFRNSPQWEEIYQKIGNKVIITACSKQDRSYDEYIAKSWPNIPFLDADSQISYGYLTKGQGSDEMKRTLSAAWMYENIEKGHGPLLDLYVTWGDGTDLPYEPDSCKYGDNDKLLNSTDWWGKLACDRYDFLSEGDSPTYFHLLDTGLRNLTLEEFTYGGFSGRYIRKPVTDTDPNSWMIADDNDHVLGLHGRYTSIMKWIPDIQHDFAARADWCITSDYKKANHRPDLKIKEGLRLTAKPGQMVELNAETSDPDGDNVSVSWWHYVEAGTYKTSNPISLESNQSHTVSFLIPMDAKEGETIHIIARAMDDGEHNLTYYQRVIITVTK